MAEPGSDFSTRLGSLAGRWTAYTAMGSFLLYLLGYLTLRFQLSTYGVATGIDVFDEKYLFAGCRFLVYLASTVPNILVLALVLGLILYLPYRLLPLSIKHSAATRISQWFARPTRLPLLGIVLGVALIQFAMRRCFAFGNLLFSKSLPDEWLSSLLLASDGALSLYFSGLVAGVLATGAILLCVLHYGSATGPASRSLVAILIFLVGVEFLLLPVNYGVLISTQTLPRVAELSRPEKTPEGASVWLVWDSKDELTYFVRGASDQRTLVSLPRKDSTVTIVGYDDVFCDLFSRSGEGPRPCPR